MSIWDVFRKTDALRRPDPAPPRGTALTRTASTPRLAPVVGTRPSARVLSSRARAQVRSSLFDQTIGFNGGWSLLRGDMPTQYQGTGRNVRTKGWEQHPTVNACVRAIVTMVGAVGLEVCKPSGAEDGTLEVITDRNDPLVKLLSAPRVAMSPYRLRALTGMHFSIYGNALWHLERPRNRMTGKPDPAAPPEAIRLIHPEHVHHVWLDPDTTEILQYDWRDRFGLVHHSGARDIVHFPDLNGMDWLFGYPRAAAALQDIIADGEATQYVRQVVRNDGSPTLIFLGEDNADPDALKAARERWYERTATRGERGRTEFVGDVKDVKVVGFNLGELEFPSLRQVAREDICTAFGVDPRMIGVGSATQRGRGGMNSKEFEEARYKLIQHTVKPILKDLESQLNLWLASEFEDRVLRFSPSELYDLTENETETWERVGKAVERTIITREEARSRLKVQGEEDEEDTLLLGKGATIETVEQAMLPPEPVPLPGATPGGPGGKQGPPGAEADAGAARKGETPGKAAEGNPDDEPTRAAKPDANGMRLTLWRMADQRATREEIAYKRAAADRFAEEKLAVDRILGRLLAGRAAVPDPIDGEIADDVLWRRALAAIARAYGLTYTDAWAHRFATLYGATMRGAVERIARTPGASFADPQDRVAAAIQERATRLAQVVTETTMNRIRDVLAGARDAGMSMHDAAALLNETVFGGDADVRATRIARTETIGALNEGEFLGAALSGVIGEKEWLTQGDDRVRDSHANQDGARVPMDQRFANGCLYPGDPAGAPDEIINCRCTLLFHPHALAGAGSPAGVVEPNWA